MQATSPRPLVDCPACGAPLRSVGRLPVRSDAGVLAVVAGDAAGAVGLDVYRCHDCGRVEIYDHDFLLPGS